jgi:hypothetical protein
MPAVSIGALTYQENSRPSSQTSKPTLKVFHYHPLVLVKSFLRFCIISVLQSSIFLYIPQIMFQSRKSRQCKPTLKVYLFIILRSPCHKVIPKITILTDASCTQQAVIGQEHR